MKKRRSIYQQAKENNPARWSGEIRNWSPVENVWLNPPIDIREQDQLMDIAA